MCGIVIVLILCTFWDIRTKTLPVWALAGLQACAAFLFWQQAAEGGWDQMFGILPGGLCFVFSRMTKEALGYGDCWMIFALGMALGLRKILGLLSLASLLCAAVSLLLLVVGVRGRESQLPFVPFLLLGFLGVTVL